MENTYTFELCAKEVKIIADALAVFREKTRLEAAQVEVVHSIFVKNAAEQVVRV